VVGYFKGDKALPETIEKPVSDLEEMVWDVPRLLDIRFEAVHARFRAQGQRLDALERRMGSLEPPMDSLGQPTGSLEGKVDALPRVLDERESRKS
jgi:hypothetical protein